MRQRLHTTAMVVAIAVLGGVGLAAAQNPAGGAPGSGQGQLNLNQAQGRMVNQGLKGEQAQSAPGYQGQVGSKPPDSATPHALPNNVTEQVPQTRNFLFVKLPDRILLIDPVNRLVAEIVPADETTGSGAGGASPANRASPPSPSSPESPAR